MRIAVVGATGMVGEIMLKVLAERNFPVTELIPVASEKSVGKEIEFGGKKYKVVALFCNERLSMTMESMVTSVGRPLYSACSKEQHFWTDSFMNSKSEQAHL